MVRPVVLPALVLTGLASGLLSAGAPALWLAAAVAAASVSLLIDAPDRRAVAWCACAFLAAGWEGAVARERARASPLQDWFDAVAPDGRVADAVEVHGRLTADAAVVDAGVRLQIAVDTVSVAAQERRMSGAIQAHVGGQFAAIHAAEWTAGRSVAVPMLLREPQVLRNPGGVSDLWLQLHRSVDLVGSIKSGTLVRVAPGAWWDEAGARVRRRVRETVAHLVAPRSAQSSAIVAAILIGDRAGLSEDVLRRLRMAGTYHVIAISGGNVAILTACGFLVLRRLVRSHRTVAILTIALVAAYGWLVGNQPSVERAVTAASIYLAASLIGLRPRPLHVLGTTATIIAIADPLVVLDAGAWLSFGATLGIVTGAARFEAWARGSPGGLPASPSRSVPASRPGRLAALSFLWRALLALLSATVAAELVLLPIAAALFGRVGVLGLVLNFIAIPAMTVVQLAGLVVAACDGWWTSAAVIAARVSDLAASRLVDSSMAVDRAPWLVWRTPPTPLWWAALFYAGLALASLPVRRRALKTVGVCTTALSALVIVLAPQLEAAGPAGRLRVSVLDVGQGDAIAVQFPDGRSLLVDAGGAPGATDVGSRVVTPALWALGIRRLDWMAVTHGDVDHVGGALSVARDFQPREIWEGIPVPRNHDLLALREAAHDLRIAWRQLQVGHRLELGAVVLDVLHPAAADWERQKVRNDDALVLRICFGNVEWLLTGDAGVEFESQFHDDRPAPLRLLKVAHHGSLSSSSARFVDAFAPAAAFVSVGRANFFNHPAPLVTARFEREGAILFRTDRDGAIVTETDGASVEIRTMSGRAWRIAAMR